MYKRIKVYWKKLSSTAIKQRVFTSLSENVNYRSAPVLGVPATFLDPEEFYEDAPFLENAPFMSVLIANPNHIGCHTLIEPAAPFAGTQKLEVELVKLCAEQVFGGEPDAQDGYVASGGTEANIEALWIYRNYFNKELGAANHEIAVVCSEDSHYSMQKGSNLLGVDLLLLPVDNSTRAIDPASMKRILLTAKEQGKGYFIFVLNMGTTMFGSIDNIEQVTSVIHELKLNFKLHVDAAFGGFIYPFVNPNTKYSFKNEDISSFTIDGHKLLQSPYGTGIFLIRKGLMGYACTEAARYIPGKDYTLCGSRSGANAVSVWMILNSYGSEGWRSKMMGLIDRTDDLCQQLDRIDIPYYRHPDMNIVAIRASAVPKDVAEKYLLVADDYSTQANWWKIVMMPHVGKGMIDRFLADVKQSATKKRYV